MLYAISGVQGSGKTTIMRELLHHNPHITQLITYTTRSPRPDEVNGVDYHFISEGRFQELLSTEYFVYPIEYRMKHYGIAMSDLLVTKVVDTIAVLRPDSYPDLRLLVPLVGIYIFTVQNEVIPNPQDKPIYENIHLCDYQVENVWGNIAIAVEGIEKIIQKHSGG